jgi:hypothetical protein
VAGLRKLAALETTSMSGMSTQSEHRALRAPEIKAMRAAVSDLKRRGYDLGAFALNFLRPGRVQNYPLPRPRSVPPRPFALVSRAGRQSAARLHANTETCTSGGATSSCAGLLFVEAGVPLPSALSVVRPGERIRFTTGGPIEPYSLGLTVTSLCAGSLARPVVGTFINRPTWRVRLRPGAYLARVSFSWPGDVEESGLFGLLVSRTRPLAVLPKPACR